MRPHHHPHHPQPSLQQVDNPNPARPTTTTALRKKGTGVRAWLFLDSTGHAQVLEAGKQAIMRRTGIPARDLRILDPLLSYPSTILGRERAIVVSLEHIKAIITAHEVLLLNSGHPTVTPFVDELQTRLSCHYHATKAQEGNGDDSSWTNLYDLVEPKLRDARPGNAAKVLPFEFVVLEACLEAACNCVENEAKTLEQEAYPILDKLTSKISTLNLERVRQLKSRLVALTGRVHKVRDELEHLLDDDEDMAEMYLTDKLVQQQLENSSTSSINERDGMDDEVIQSDMGDRTPAEITLEGDLQNTDNNQDNLFSTEILLNVVELEMLLEAYFVQIDGTLNKLSTLREYVDDTEDYINMMLDDKQNNLLQMGVMLTTATLVVSAFIVVCGILGMNIHINLWVKDNSSMKKFLWTIGGGVTGCIFLYASAIAWCKHKRLL